MVDGKTNIILCGDPKQLGPIVQSPIARELEYGKSYLERLVESPAYDQQRGAHGKKSVLRLNSTMIGADEAFFQIKCD